MSTPEQRRFAQTLLDRARDDLAGVAVLAQHSLAALAGFHAQQGALSTEELPRIASTAVV